MIWPVTVSRNVTVMDSLAAPVEAPTPGPLTTNARFGFRYLSFRVRSPRICVGLPLFYIL